MKKLIILLCAIFMLCTSIAYAADYSDVVYTAYGDSITEIYQNMDIVKYPELMKIKFSLAKVNNLGIGSSCLTTDTPSVVTSGIENIINHSAENKTSDIVTICYGTNDWYYGVELGTITDSRTDTYWGAFNTAIKQLRSDNPSVEIIVLSPIWRSAALNGTGSADTCKNQAGVTLAEFVEEIEKMCSANSVRFIDLYSSMGVREQTASLYTSDGLHPNQKGHIRIANLICDTFGESLSMNEFEGLIHNDGFNSADTVVPDPAERTNNITDFVDTSRGAVTGLDETNNRPQKEESTGNIIAKSGVHNFYIQTTNESANMFTLFTDGTYSYGVMLSNDATYGKHLCRTNLQTGAIDSTTEFLEYSEYYNLPSAGKNLWHFSYSEQNGAWYIYTVDADGVENFTAKITRDNLESSLWSNLDDTEPLFVYTGWGAYCFTLINDTTPAAKFSLEDETLTAELYNVDDKIALAFGVYNENNELTDVALPEIVDNKAAAKLNLNDASSVRIYFWTALEKLVPIMKDEKINLE